MKMSLLYRLKNENGETKRDDLLSALNEIELKAIVHFSIDAKCFRDFNASIIRGIYMNPNMNDNSTCSAQISQSTMNETNVRHIEKPSFNVCTFCLPARSNELKIKCEQTTAFFFTTHNEH